MPSSTCCHDSGNILGLLLDIPPTGKKENHGLKGVPALVGTRLVPRKVSSTFWTIDPFNWPAQALALPLRRPFPGWCGHRRRRSSRRRSRRWHSSIALQHCLCVCGFFGTAVRVPTHQIPAVPETSGNILTPTLPCFCTKKNTSLSVDKTHPPNLNDCVCCFCMYRWSIGLA